MTQGQIRYFIDVKKIIFNWNLTEAEAFAAEASLINAFNYVSDTGLTNIVAGHHSAEALSVEDFEKIYGAEELRAEDVKHRIMVIKINNLYRRNMPEKELYDAVRGLWKVNHKRAQSVEYVFGVYKSLIVGVYKPTRWYMCNNDIQGKRPRPYETLTSKTENRLFFVDDDFEHGEPLDANQNFYLWKSIAGLKINQRVQNPVTYINPQNSYRRWTAVAEMKQINDFASKWLKKFKDPDIDFIELVDHFMADDCESLGFKMDCGKGFSEKYGEAVYNHKELMKIIDSITDIPLLGSAIYSRWRYFNHWAYDGVEILEPENRAWFVSALNRLAELSDENHFLFRGTLN